MQTKEVQGGQRTFTGGHQLIIALVGLAAVATGYVAMSHIATSFKSVKQALSQREDYDRSFVEVMKSNFEEQRAAISTLQKTFGDIASVSRDIISPAGAFLGVGVNPRIYDDARLLRESVEAATRAIPEVARLNEESEASIRNWVEASQHLRDARRTENFSFINPAFSKEWKPKQANVPPMVVPPPAPPAVTAPPPHPNTDRVDRLSPFLWAFLAVPFVFGLIAFFYLNSTNPKVQDFAISTIIAILGYFSGLGAGAFAVVLA
jgi:hypothetical protein